MTLTELTIALHRWADKHGGFPDIILCNQRQQLAWAEEVGVRFECDMRTTFKGVLVLSALSPDDARILFASSPDA